MTVATGSMIAFGDAIHSCLETAYRVAEQLTDSPRQAEDCLTEAAMIGSRVRPQLDSGADVGPWFLGLVLRTCGSRYRRWEMPTAIPLPDDGGLPLYEATQAARWADGDGDAARMLFNQLDAADVAAALRSLPWELRKVAALYYVAGYRYADLAIALETSREQLRPLLHRARRALQRALCARARAAGILPAA